MTTTDTQTELNIWYAIDYEDFLIRERLFEQEENKVETVVRAFLLTFVLGGIFLTLLIWRITR